MNYSKRHIYILTAIASLFFTFAYSSSHAVYNGCDSFKGTGTVEDPFQIETSCQLLSVGFVPGNLTLRYRQTTNIDATVPSNVLPIIGRQGQGFRPIGAIYDRPASPTDTAPRRIGTDFFIGSYDGGGYKITNLRIDRPGEDYVGLFARAAGNVRNVEIVGANVVGRNYVGALAGENIRTIRNSNVSNSVVRASSPRSDAVTGGLVGVVGDAGTLSYGYSTGTTVIGSKATGGLVGVLEGGSINDSYVVGTTVVGRVAGGFVGQSSSGAMVSNSFAAAMVVLATPSTPSTPSTPAVSTTPEALQGALIAEAGDSRVVSSYALQTTGVELIGRSDNNMLVGGSGLRNLAQLRCSISPGEVCAGTTTYQGWSTQFWTFGEPGQFPVLVGDPPSEMSPVIAGEAERTLFIAEGVAKRTITFSADYLNVSLSLAPLQWTLREVEVGSSASVAFVGSASGATVEVSFTRPANSTFVGTFVVRVTDNSSGLFGKVNVRVENTDGNTPPQITEFASATIMPGTTMHRVYVSPGLRTTAVMLRAVAVDIDNDPDNLSWFTTIRQIQGTRTSVSTQRLSRDSVNVIGFISVSTRSTVVTEVSDGTSTDRLTVALEVRMSSPVIVINEGDTESPSTHTVSLGATEGLQKNLVLFTREPWVGLKWEITPLLRNNPARVVGESGERRAEFELALLNGAEAAEFTITVTAVAAQANQALSDSIRIVLVPRSDSDLRLRMFLGGAIR